MPESPPPAGEEAALRSVHTSNLPAIFDRLHISLVVSTYQAGKVILIRQAQGTLNTHFRAFAKPMGLAVDAARLAIGGPYMVWDCRNMPAVARKLEPQGTHDAFYLPQRIHVTGDIDIHELAWAETATSGWSTPALAACVRWTPSTASHLAGDRHLSPPWLRRTAATSTASHWWMGDRPMSPPWAPRIPRGLANA
jgi:uncharacterized protein (TIGR03032 family)